MTDHLTVKQRSWNMSRIKSKDSVPEIRVRKLLHSLGFRYKLYDPKLPGKPDLVFPKYKLALFVHGCFWHKHQGCKRSSNPSSNKEYWNAKLDRNVKRDAENKEALLDLGWNPGLIWECETKDANLLMKAVKREFKGIIN